MLVQIEARPITEPDEALEPPKPVALTCPSCGGTMVPYGDRYKCANCGALL